MRTSILFMQRCLLLISIGITPIIVKAQKSDSTQQFQTLFGDNYSYGGYGAISFGYTKIADYDAFASGIKGAWIVGHSLGIGFEGAGFISELTTGLLPGEDYSYIAGGYGGLLIEPILFGMKPVHVAFPVVMGAGAVVFESSSNYYPNYPHDYYSTDYDQFYLIQPGIEVELNITRFFRLALGGNYRFTSDIDLSTENITNEKVQILDNKDLNSYSFYLGFKFGKF